MIFKRYRDILDYIKQNESFGNLSEIRKYIEESLQKGFKLFEYQFIQTESYTIDIYGTVKPILGEMKDSETLRQDVFGNEVCNHIVTFLAKKNPNDYTGSFITPDNKIFKIDITPKTKTEYQKLTVVEILEM